MKKRIKAVLVYEAKRFLFAWSIGIAVIRIFNAVKQQETALKELKTSLADAKKKKSVDLLTSTTDLV